MSKNHLLGDDPLLQTIHMDWGLSDEEIKIKHENDLKKKLKEYEAYLDAGEPEYSKAFLVSAEGTIKLIREILCES